MSDRLAEIRARLDAATPGPWCTVTIPESESEIATPGGEPVGHVDLYHEFVPLVPVEGQHRPEQGINVFRADMAKPEARNVACLVHVTESDPNVAFIAHAPEDIAYLLAELARVLGGARGDTTPDVGASVPAPRRDPRT